MPSSYVVWMATPLGRRLWPLDLALIDLEYVKRINGVGWVKIRYGLGDLDLGTLVLDRQLQIWRKPPGGQLDLDAAAFLREWNLKYVDGVSTVTLKGPDQNDLLNRRIVAYAAGTSQATTTTNVDDAMKDVFNENLIGGATDTDRDWSGNSLTVAGDTSDGTAIEKAFAWRNCLDVLQEMNEASRADGNEVFFNIVPLSFGSDTTTINLEFQTFTGQPGADKTSGTGSKPVVFSPEWGTLEEATVTYDHTQEQNYIYAGGQGEGSDRDVQEASDSDLINASPWGRREGFKDARNEETSAAVLDAANDRLIARRPFVTFTGRLLDTENMRYGLDWFLGDKVTASVFGQQYDGVIRAVRVKVDQDGEETITAHIESTAVVA
jgi:hypothetical protein